MKQKINSIGRLERNEGATMFFIIQKLEETTFKLKKNAAAVVWFWPCVKMKTQKIINLLGNADSEFSKFATRKSYVINDQIYTDCGEGSEDGTTVIFEAKVVKWKLCVIQKHIFL